MSAHPSGPVGAQQCVLVSLEGLHKSNWCPAAVIVRAVTWWRACLWLPCHEIKHLQRGPPTARSFPGAELKGDTGASAALTEHGRTCKHCRSPGKGYPWVIGQLPMGMGPPALGTVTPLAAAALLVAGCAAARFRRPPATIVHRCKDLIRDRGLLTLAKFEPAN